MGKSNKEVSLDDIGSATGYNMAMYSRTLNGKTEWVLVNAGTNDLIDVGSDKRNLTGSSDQYTFSVRFAKSLQNGMGGQEMTYVGHLLGGALAAQLILWQRVMLQLHIILPVYRGEQERRITFRKINETDRYNHL